MAGKGLTTEGGPGCRGSLFTAGSPKANSRYRLNSEAGALYSQVPRGKLWFCFKSPSRTSFTPLHICIDTVVGLCVFLSCVRAVLQKHLVIKEKNTLPFFPLLSSCSKDLIQFLSSCRKKCLCGTLVVVVLPCKGTVL